MEIPFEIYIKAFVLLCAVIDPLGTVPVFIAATRQHPEGDKRSIAVQAVIIATGILLFFLIAGQVLLEQMGIPLSAFQIAGGIVLFLFSLTMIFSESKLEGEMNIIKSGRDTAIFPLAIPSIASPGAILAIVLLTDNHRFNILHQTYIAVIMLLVLAITLSLLLLGEKIHKLIGDSGASVASRVMGLILGSVAANDVLLGIKEFFRI
jgi:multiple antibiotic resistance protein